MEVILECIFDEVFARLDRGCLLARYKRRQLTDYLSTVIRGSSADNHQLGCERAVRAAMKFHHTSREGNGHICLMGKYHNVLYVAATLCFDWRLDNTDIVARLLQDIYECEQTFERLLVGAILGTKVTHLISGWKSDFRSREECVHAVEYFLEHATRANLTFDYRGVKRQFVDVPMDSYGKATPLRVAAQAGQPDILEILLNYGATVTPHPADKATCAMQLLLYRMNDFYHETDGDIIAPQFVQCLNLLLRELPMLPALLPDSEAEPPTEFLDDSLEVHPMIFTLVPPERSGYVTAPCLRHMCRCVIRQELRTRGQLPHGLSRLILPDSLILFLSHREP